MRMVTPDGKVVKPRRVTKSGYASGGDPVSHLPKPLDPGPAGAAQPTVNLERDRRLRAVEASIPEHLRSSPEAQLLLSRIASTYDLIPASERQKQQWSAEWARFLEGQPEAVMARAQAAGIVLPGVPQAPHGSPLWTPT